MEHAETIAERLAGPVEFHLDADGAVAWANPAALALLGIDAAAAPGGRLRAQWPEVEAWNRKARQALRGGARAVPAQELPVGASARRYRWRLLRAPADGTAAFRLVGVDAALWRALLPAVRLMLAVAEQYAGCVLLADAACNVVYANAALLRLLGLSGETDDGAARRALFADRLCWAEGCVSVRRDAPFAPELLTLREVDGLDGVRWLAAFGECVPDYASGECRAHRIRVTPPGAPGEHFALLRALGDRVHLASARGEAVLVLAIAAEAPAADGRSLDETMEALAHVVRGALRETDLLCRFEVDRLAVVLGPYASVAQPEISALVERLSARVGELGRREMLGRVPAIGSAAYPRDAETPGDVLICALDAMSRSRHAGGAVTPFVDEAASVVGGHRRLFADLRHALAERQMSLHFQPKISLYSGEIVGAEALIRWHHPLRGMVFPGDFIPLVENDALIVEIGEWTLREACRQLCEWRERGFATVPVSVNLAARHLMDPGLLATVAAALAQCQLAPGTLEVEITESAVMGDILASARVVRGLKELGVRVSLDDFGTGYSSLAYLASFPVDCIKIDRSFVSDIDDNPTHAVIVQATIAMAHKLGISVVAEGVESMEQARYLRRNHCDDIQGFLFSRPVPVPEFEALVQQGRRLPLAEHDAGGRRETVLLVDDEESVLQALRRELRAEGYEALFAASAEEALRLLAQHEVQVVISDQRMPQMNGTDFLYRVKTLYPRTVRMVLSGKSDLASVADSVNRGGIFRFIAKPWEAEELKAEIRYALRTWREQFDLDNAMSAP